jgi:crotonobetainyl-CoA:carnitine CoA-transferase CaiB-like acyl-CoA transferase
LYTVEDLVKSEHLVERQFFTEVEHPEVGKLKYPGPPFRLNETPWMINRRSPLCGEHNEEIYCNRLGYTKQNLVELRASSVI